MGVLHFGYTRKGVMPGETSTHVSTASFTNASSGGGGKRADILLNNHMSSYHVKETVMLRPNQFPMFRLLAAAALALALAAPARAVDYTWVGADPGGDLWDTAANWSPNGVPAGTDKATFDATALAANRAVDLGLANQAADVVVLQTSDGTGYTIGSTGGFTLTVNTRIEQGGTDAAAITCKVATGATAVELKVAGSLTISGAISGAAGLTKTDAGTAVLSGDNSFGGAGQSVSVQAGTLQLGHDNALGSTSNDLVISGGATLDIGAFNPTAGAVTLTNGNIIGTGTLTGASYDVRSGAVSAKLGGAGVGLTKTTAGTVTLSGANTYTGLTYVGFGTLALGASDVLADASNVSVDGGTLAIGAFDDTVGAVTLNAGSITGTTGTLSGASYDVRSGAVSAKLGGAGVALTKTTAGTVTLSGANTYTGGTNVNLGTLALGASDVLEDTGAVVVGGGTLAIGAFSDTVGAVTLVSGAITGTTGTLSGASYDVRGGSASAILGGGGGGGMTKSTAGTVLLTGTNTFTGGVAISDGTLSISKAAALGDAGNTVALGGGTLNATQSMALAYPMTVTGAGSALGADAGKRMVVLSAVLGTEGLEKKGDGWVYLSNVASSFGGAGDAMTVKDGILSIGKWQVLGDAATKLVLDGGTLEVTSGVNPGGNPFGSPFPGSRDMEIAAGGGTIVTAQGQTLISTSALTGSGDLVKLGGGELRFLQNTSGYTGAITLGYSYGNTNTGGARRSEFRLRNNAVLTGVTGLTIETAALFHLDNDPVLIADRLSNTAPIIMKGGEFRLNGRNAANAATTETVGVVSIDRGHSIITARRPQGSSSVVLTLSGLTRNTGATVTFSNDNTGTLGATGNNARIMLAGYSTASLNDGMIGGWATVSTGTATGLYTTGDFWATYTTAGGIYPLASPATANINTAAATANVRIAAAQTLTTDRTWNSLIIAGNYNLPQSGARKVTLDSGGLIKTGNNNNTISVGTLTAGTTAAPAELFIWCNFAGGNNLNISSVIADNTASGNKVTLVKEGGGRLILSGANTYTGGTFVNGNGCLETGTVAARTYLGKGPVTLRQGSWLDLKTLGAAADPLNAGRTVINVEDNADLVLYVSPNASEYYSIGPNAGLLALSGTSLAGLAWGTNLTVSTGATLNESTAGQLAAIGGTKPTTPTAYFGPYGTAIAATEAVTVGAGTPWLGISTFAGTGTMRGTITANSDFVLRGAMYDSNTAPRALTLGSGTTGTDKCDIIAATPVVANVVGRVDLNYSAANYGNVTFAVGLDGELRPNQSNSMGGGGTNDPAKMASIVVYSHGVLNPAAGAGLTSMNGPVTIMPGGRIIVDDGALAGTGVITLMPGAIVQAGNNLALFGGQLNAASIQASTILRISAASIVNLNLVNGGATFELTGSYAIDGIDINLAGGLLTQLQSNDYTLSGTGNVNINSASTIASSTDQTLTISNTVQGTGPLNIGTTDLVEGTTKLGTVYLSGEITVPTINIPMGTLIFRKGYDGGPGLPSTMTINLSGTGEVRGRTLETPTLPMNVNLVEAVVNLSGVGPKLNVERDNNDTFDGLLYYRDVRVADGADFYVDRSSGSMVANVALAGNAAVQNAAGGTFVGLADITGSGGGSTLEIKGSQPFRLVGALNNVDLLITSTGTTVLADFTNLVGLGKKFSLNNRIIDARAGTLQVGGGWGSTTAQEPLWNLEMGPGTIRLLTRANTATAPILELRSYAGTDALPVGTGWGADLTLELGAGSQVRGRVEDAVNASDPRYVNRFDGLILVKDNYAGNYDAMLTAQRLTDKGGNSQFTFNRIRPENGATVAMDQDNARFVGNFDLALGAGEKAYIRANDDNDVAVGNLTGTGELELLGAVSGNRPVDFIGSLSPGMTLSVNIGTVASTGWVRVRGPADGGNVGPTGFELNGGTLKVIHSGLAYYVEVQGSAPKLNNGYIVLGEIGTTAGGGLEVRHGDDGSTYAFGDGVTVTMQNGVALRGFVRRGTTTPITQVMNAPVTVNDDDGTPDQAVDGLLASSKSDISAATQGSLLGTVQFTDVTLGNGSRTRLEAATNRSGSEYLVLGGPSGTVTVVGSSTVPGSAALVNDSSDFLISVSNLTGAAHTAVFAGTAGLSRWTRLDGAATVNRIQVGEGWTSPGPPPTGPLPGRLMLVSGVDLSGMGAGGVLVAPNGELLIATPVNGIVGNTTAFTVQAAGWMYVADSTFAATTLTLDPGSNTVMVANWTLPSAATQTGANLYMGREEYTATLNLNTAAAAGVNIGVFLHTGATMVNPLAGGPAGAANVKFQDGGTETYKDAWLTLGDGLDPLAKVMIANMGGPTAVTIDRNLILRNKSTYTGGTTIDSSNTYGTSGVSDHTVVVLHKDALGTGGDVTLQASAAVTGVPPLPDLPARLTTLSICADGFTLGAGKVILNPRTQVRLHYDTPVNMEMNGGAIVAAADVTAGGTITENVGFFANQVFDPAGHTLTFQSGVNLLNPRTWDVKAGTVVVKGNVTGSSLTV
ncbi:MAG: hypothetical protein FJ288_11500, partial [Planctomycetes bacterium]|nr:hypothetical protein [Planctomycetota bacterium]